MPTEAEVFNAWRNATKLLNETLKYARFNSPNFITIQGDIRDTANSDFSQDINSPIITGRASLASIIASSHDILLPHIKAYCTHIINIPTDVETFMLRKMYEYFLANSKTVKERGITFGNISVGAGNIGNGTVKRLTKDSDGVNIQNTTADVKKVRCIGGDATGNESAGEEIFEIYGTNGGIDSIDNVSGSGLVGTLQNSSGNQSLLANPSFALYSGSETDPTAITGWDSDIAVSGANYNINTADYFRTFDGEGTPASLEVIASNVTLTQAFSANSISLDPNVPYMLQLGFNAQSDWAGTISIQVGSSTTLTTVTATGLTGWNILRIEPAVIQDYFAKNFVNNGFNTLITIIIARTGGTDNLLIDDVLFVPFTKFDGLHYCVVPNAVEEDNQPFIDGDSFTFTDSEPSPIADGINQWWFYKAFGLYLPSTTGAPTFTDP